MSSSVEHPGGEPLPPLGPETAGPATVESQVAELVRQRKRTLRSAAVLNQRLQDLDTKLLGLRKHLSVVCCDCEVAIRIGTLILLRQDRGSWDRHGEFYTHDILNMTVCPHCAAVMVLPLEGIERFPGPITQYVKRTIEYHRDREPPEVQIMLQPSRDAARKRERDYDRLRELEHARKLLREAGELPETVKP